MYIRCSDSLTNFIQILNTNQDWKSGRWKYLLLIKLETLEDRYQFQKSTIQNPTSSKKTFASYCAECAVSYFLCLQYLHPIIKFQWSLVQVVIQPFQEDKSNCDIYEVKENKSTNSNSMNNHLNEYGVDLSYKPDFMEMDGAYDLWPQHKNPSNSHIYL